MQSKINLVSHTQQGIMQRLSRFLSRLRNGEERNNFWLSLKLNPAKMGRFENKRETPSLGKLIEICNKTHLSANWVLLGKGPEYLTEEEPLSANEIVDRTCNELLKLLAQQKRRPRKEIIDLVKGYRDEARTTAKNPGTISDASPDPARNVERDSTGKISGPSSGRTQCL